MLSHFFKGIMQNLPRIYNYYDYREFLKDVFMYFKNQKVSIRTISKDICVSNAYFSMILSHKRNLDIKYIDNIADYISLNKSERNYLKNLVLLADSDNSETRSQAYKELSRFKSYNQNKKEDVISHKYIKHWYYVAIRELSFMEGFRKDPSWIRNKLANKVTKKQANEALNFLDKNKLLFNDQLVNCNEGIYKLALTGFHKEMLKIVSDSIETVSRDKRLILGHTRAFTKKGYEEACAIMQEALERINNIEFSPQDNDLYHIYLTAVPLTLNNEENNE